MTQAIRSLPRPRGYIESAMIAVACLVPVSALICLIGMGLYDMPIDWVLISIFGLHCGLIFGVMVGYFYQQRKTTFEFLDSDEFLQTLDLELRRFLYWPASRSENFTIYKSKWYSSRGWFHMRMFEDCATLVGPKYFMDRLARRLEQEQVALGTGSTRQGD